MMKKSLIALAALASIGSAFAQSTVTLSGFVAGGYQQKPNAAKEKGLTYTDYNLTFGAVEDLGGGLKASLSTTLTDSASSLAYGATANTNNAQYRSVVGRDNTTLALSGGFGTVALVNSRSGDLLTTAFVAPASLPDGIYDSSSIISRSPVDALTYTTPKFGDLSGYIQRVEFTPDGNAKAASTANVVGVNYATGPLTVAANYKSYSGTGFTAAGIRTSNIEAAATYDFGIAKVGVGFDGKRAGLVTDKAAVSLGVAAPFGPVVVGVNYAKRDAAKMHELVAQYNLSKRTHLNFSQGKQSVDANNQYRIRLGHTF